LVDVECFSRFCGCARYDINVPKWIFHVYASWDQGISFLYVDTCLVPSVCRIQKT
jgi:hypothetical protein